MLNGYKRFLNGQKKLKVFFVLHTDSFCVEVVALENDDANQITQLCMKNELKRLYLNVELIKSSLDLAKINLMFDTEKKVNPNKSRQAILDHVMLKMVTQNHLKLLL